MSGWDAYVTTLTSSCPAIKRVGIIGVDGSVWARTEGENQFKATLEELKKFASQFDNINEVPGTGADLEQVHYIVPRTEPNLIFGKKDKCGFFAGKAKTVIVVAIYEGENQVSADVRKAVQSVVDYLQEAGY